MNSDRRPYNKLTPVPFYQVDISDEFWSKKQEINRKVAIYHQYDQLEKDHHFENFRIAAGLKEGTQLGEFYFDSDIYKWLEAAFYILHLRKDEDLRKKCDEVVNLIIMAQTNDGYINTFYSTKFLEKRFTNLFFMHELYCGGHLIQAAIAHHKATGSRKLLEVAEKFANLIVDIFLTENTKEAPGHQEIELALIELYRITDNSKYLNLAKDFLDRRGKSANSKKYILGKDFNVKSTMKEAKWINQDFKSTHPRGNEDEIESFYNDLSLSEHIKFNISVLNGINYQVNVPIREIIDPLGHAVRATYMYSGMADLYSETGDITLLGALNKIWQRIVKAKMYISGGIGSRKGIEGLEKDFKLKKEKSYSETCAAIGNMMWNWRMLQITADCKFADLIERLMYNAMLVGQSIDGKSFTYVNPLISKGDEKRHEWFLCACCPPNFARTIASIGKYIYSIGKGSIWLHQYIGCSVNIELNNISIKIVQESGFPWNGKVRIRLELEHNQKFSFFVRVPNWSFTTKLFINGLENENKLTLGTYIEIIRNWVDNDTIEIEFDMTPKFVENVPERKDTRGFVSIQNGPLIYCLEQKDNNSFDIFGEKFPKDQELKIDFESSFLGGINTIQGKTVNGLDFVAIPYYSWNNRGPDKMQVWLKTP
ncbi:MAG: glycoside hydrolase family 127 protein [Candidatus Lokiarchaeota archaeon]|nr:glycoside hydrolase family 127 protein [Candidatus Lokiarchaeota archaeon]